MLILQLSNLSFAKTFLGASFFFFNDHLKGSLAHSECGKGDKRRDTADVERKEGRKKVGSVTQKKLGERGPLWLSAFSRS